MPESVPGFDEMPLYDVPAALASIRQAASRRRLRSRFLRAGRQAVDDRDLLELLLSGRHAADDAGELAGCLLDSFGTAPRALAARPDRLRSVPGLSEDAIAALKAAEALGIRMARAGVPDTVRPSFGSYDKVIEYCRTLAGHREVEEFRVLYLNRKNRLIADECLHKGSVCHTPVYPREICIRCLELQASAIIVLHPPVGQPRSIPRRYRHDEPHPRRAEDDRGDAARPRHRNPDRLCELPGARPALTGRSHRLPLFPTRNPIMPQPGNATAFDPVISVYTRAQAIEDGIIVDVSETAREAGFNIPVAITRTVWDRLVALPEGYRGFQDERGRLWDVLWMARHYALRASDSDRVTMCVLVRDIRKDLRDSNRPPRKHFPIVAIGAGDDGSPVITIMFPEDD